jgi:hypothetical protein
MYTLSIYSEEEITSDLIDKVKTLPTNQNKFVCMQFVTMLNELFEKTISKNNNIRQDDTCFITLYEYDNVIYGGAIFRLMQNTNIVYIDLICCNKNKNGIGKCIVSEIEHYVKSILNINEINVIPVESSICFFVKLNYHWKNTNVKKIMFKLL